MANLAPFSVGVNVLTTVGRNNSDWGVAYGHPVALGTRFAARLIDLGIVLVGLIILGWLIGLFGGSLVGNLIGTLASSC